MKFISARGVVFGLLEIVSQVAQESNKKILSLLPIYAKILSSDGKRRTIRESKSGLTKKKPEDMQQNGEMIIEHKTIPF